MGEKILKDHLRPHPKQPSRRCQKMSKVKRCVARRSLCGSPARKGSDKFWSRHRRLQCAGSAESQFGTPCPSHAARGVFEVSWRSGEVVFRHPSDGRARWVGRGRRLPRRWGRRPQIRRRRPLAAGRRRVGRDRCLREAWSGDGSHRWGMAGGRRRVTPQAWGTAGGRRKQGAASTWGGSGAGGDRDCHVSGSAQRPPSSRRHFFAAGSREASWSRVRRRERLPDGVRGPAAALVDSPASVGTAAAGRDGWASTVASVSRKSPSQMPLLRGPRALDRGLLGSAQCLAARRAPADIALTELGRSAPGL